MRALALLAAGCGVTALDVREPAVPLASHASAKQFTLGTFDLSDALAKGGVVLVFYRGHW